VDIRIGVTQAPREVSVELADDVDREVVRKQVEAALGGAVDVLWLEDKKGRTVAIPAAKIAYVEIGSSDVNRRIGFGG
jgi:transposase